MTHRPDDPILARRARIARWCELGQRIGYGLFAGAMVLFFVGFTTGFTDALVVATVTALVSGSVVLAPAIVFSYAVRAAEREDRDRGSPPLP